MSLGTWLLIVYTVGFFMCGIINVHVVSRQLKSRDDLDDRLLSLGIGSVVLALVWPVLLVWAVIMYFGLLLTKMRG